MINSLGGGGAEKVVSIIASALARGGVEVHLLLLDDEIVYHIHQDVIVHFRQRGPNINRPKWSLLRLYQEVLWVRRILRRAGHGEYTHLISHLNRSNAINLILRLILRSHRPVCTIHNSRSLYLTQGILGQFILALQRWILPIAHRTICVSKGMAEEYRDAYAYNKDSIIFIPNPVANHGVQPTESCHDELDRNVNVAIVGRLDKNKRHDLAIEAMNLLRKLSNRRFVLHIIGTGPTEERLRIDVESKGLVDQVKFYGWIREPSDILKRCLFTLICSDSEGSPNAIIESFALGLPVIATDCSTGVRDLLGSEDIPVQPWTQWRRFLATNRGTLVARNDAVALARAIVHQIDRNDRHSMRSDCLLFAQQFDPDLISSKYFRTLG